MSPMFVLSLPLTFHVAPAEATLVQRVAHSLYVTVYISTNARMTHTAHMVCTVHAMNVLTVELQMFVVTVHPLEVNTALWGQMQHIAMTVGTMHAIIV